MSDTGWKSPSAYENNFFVTNPQYMYASDNNRAIFTVFSSENVELYNYNFPTIPTGSTIDGIEISVEASLQTVGNTPRQFVLTPKYSGRSLDAGSLFTADFGGTDTTLISGSPTYKWGRTWAPSDFTNANFSVRIQEYCNFTGNIDLRCDHLQVKVYYTAPWEGIINGVTNPDGMLGGGSIAHIPATEIAKISSHED